MSFKDQVSDRVASVVGRIEDRAEALPNEVARAKKKLSVAGGRAREVVRENPGLAVLGAFALGYALAKVARRA